jgi:hypothetical protein
VARSRALDVGVVLPGARIPAWVAWIVAEIRERDGMNVAVVAFEDTAPTPPAGRLFWLYERLDRRLFAPRPDALAETDVAGVVDGVPRVALGEAAELRSRDLDVLLWLGRGAPRGDVAAAARYGVWTYRHGSDPSGPPLFAELFRGDKVTESALEIVDGERRRAIYRSIAGTDPVSLQRNRNPAYWKSARFALRRLEDLAAGRWQPGQHEVEPEPEPPSLGSPSNALALRHAATVAGRVARRKLGAGARQHQWFLGFRRRLGDRMPYEESAPWQLCYPPPDRSYADPFVVSEGSETLVFFEQIVHARGRGELAVGRLDGGRLTDIEPILPAAHHMSYPYVFRDGARRFLVPESGAIRRVELFAAVDFPTRWERVAALLDGVEAVDASIHRHGGLYWMWVNIAVPGGRLTDEAFLYFSDRVETGWMPHPRNPVVSDARRARPAGRPFAHGDRLIRPSQDCTGRYGARTVFNEVEVLSPDEYRERPLGFLGPAWAGGPNLAAHSYTFDGAWEATDGLRTFSRLRTIRAPRRKRRANAVHNGPPMHRV